MIEGGGSSRFLGKTLQTSGIGRKRRRQNLDSDVACQARIVGAVDLTHTACANLSDHLVRTNLLSR